MESLREIGKQLDDNVFPYVLNGGIVVPNTTSASLLNLGEENIHDTTRTKKITQPRWTRTIRRKRATCHISPVVSDLAKARCQEQLDAVIKAYPSARLWRQKDGLWLLTESALLPGERYKAIFTTCISYVWPFSFRSWGFWEGKISTNPVWIGPRHTNFPDGSICAFEPSDETWALFKQSIVELLDIYTVWALRHLHLEILGRWPGQQVVKYAHERIVEQKENELCGCGESGELYGNCCRDKDLARDKVVELIEFGSLTGGGVRKPPQVIVEFATRRQEPPSITKLLL